MSYDTRRVLRNHRDDHAHAIDAVSREGLEIGLDTSTATAIRTSDSQNILHGSPLYTTKNTRHVQRVSLIRLISSFASLRQY